MNAFANWMFSALLGWTGGVANRIWNSVSGGKSWFASLLSTIWLPLLLIIIAVCTLIDAGYALKQRSILRKNNLLSHMLAKKRTDMFSKEPVDISDNYAAAPETSLPRRLYTIFLKMIRIISNPNIIAAQLARSMIALMRKMICSIMPSIKITMLSSTTLIYICHLQSITLQYTKNILLIIIMAIMPRLYKNNMYMNSLCMNNTHMSNPFTNNPCMNSLCMSSLCMNKLLMYARQEGVGRSVTRINSTFLKL